MKDKKYYFWFQNLLPFRLYVLVQLQKPFLAKKWNYYKYSNKLVVNIFPIQLDFERNYNTRWRERRNNPCPRYKTIGYLLTGRVSYLKCKGYCPTCD